MELSGRHLYFQMPYCSWLSPGPGEWGKKRTMPQMVSSLESKDCFMLKAYDSKAARDFTVFPAEFESGKADSFLIIQFFAFWVFFPAWMKRLWSFQLCLILKQTNSFTRVPLFASTVTSSTHGFSERLESHCTYINEPKALSSIQKQSVSRLDTSAHKSTLFKNRIGLITRRSLDVTSSFKLNCLTLGTNPLKLSIRVVFNFLEENPCLL